MISIIIPVYNQAEALSDCLDSILKQSYDNYEVIVINDGSIDETALIAEKYQNIFKKQGKKFIYAKHTNQGPQKTRNAGYRLSSGNFLLFCDADAILSQTMLEEQINASKEHPEAGYTYSSFVWGFKKFRVGKFDSTRLKKEPYINTVSLIRREAFPESGWDENIKRFQDWDLWLTILKNGYEGYWIDKTLFKVQRKEEQTMSSWLPSFAYRFLTFLPKVKKYNEAKKIIKQKHNLK